MVVGRKANASNFLIMNVVWHRVRSRAVLGAVTVLVIAATVTGVMTGRATAEEKPAHRPLIIVPGLLGPRPGEVLPEVFPEFIARFKAAGWSDKDLILFRYDWTQPNERTAEQLAATIERVRPRTGNPEVDKVDIVAHSMGSLSSRYYLRFLGGTQRVKHWVSIGGVNHGTIVPCPGFAWASCHDMTPHSPMVEALNEGDETPGDVRYQTQSSSCDELAVPHATVRLAGAENRDVGCLEHIYLPRSATVFEVTRDFLLR